MPDKKTSNHIRLTSHPDSDTQGPPIRWGDPDPLRRGPVIATLTEPAHRNVVGTHSGSYAIYRAIAVAAGQLT
ncbi:MAG TPA: hypothetical protein VF664_12195, partial [Cystobacter sp.]